jgi:hypothetical protein
MILKGTTLPGGSHGPARYDRRGSADPSFKPTASAKETEARGRRLLLRMALQAAKVIARARILGNALGLKDSVAR